MYTQVNEQKTNTIPTTLSVQPAHLYQQHHNNLRHTHVRKLHGFYSGIYGQRKTKTWLELTKAVVDWELDVSLSSVHRVVVGVWVC